MPDQPTIPNQIAEIQHSTTNSSDHKTVLDPNIQAQSAITDPAIPEIESNLSANSEDQKQEDEDELEARRIYRGLEDRNEAVVVQRPPPEPPDLKSSVEELFAMQTRACQNVIEVAENEASRSTEVGAFAKGKRIATTLEDIATPVEDETTTVTNGGLRARCLRRFVLLNPPPLLVAILPWDRDNSEKRGAGMGAVGLGSVGAPRHDDRGRNWALLMLAVAPPWMADALPKT
ncbi:hypothetical protein PIB30_095703, partial [Stylosanthes scabra]|nr:hypothetical protein [Stylosanthes scabra]